MDERQKQRALASSLSRMGSGILKVVSVVLQWLFDENLGYTSMGGNNSCKIHVSWYLKEYFDPLSEEERDALRIGVFAHELLHQLLTDFAYTNKVTAKMTRAEAAVFMQFANTIEDPAIEYFAPQCFGGKLLECLRFTIRHIYKLSPGIEKSPTAFSQLLNALIHFGDMGLVKGKWTFPEAKEYFAKVAPIYNEAITCPNSRKRIDYAKQCMEITRPLWEEDVKNADLFEKLLEELAKFLKREGAHIMSDDELDPDSEASKSEASMRRSGLVNALKKASEEKGGEPQDGEGEEGEGEGSSLGSASDDLDSLSDEEGDKSLDKDGKDGKSKGSSGKDSPKKSGKPSGSDDVKSSDPVDDATADEEAANETASEMFDIDDELLDNIEKSLETEAKALEKGDAKEASGESSGSEVLPDFDIRSDLFRGKTASCLNRRMNNTSSARTSAMYAEALRAYSYEIKSLTKTLDRLFKADRESVVAATSGEYNIIRGCMGTTARIFDRKRDPDKLKDAAVVLLVDLSGSMGGSKVNQARKTAITLAEALTSCRIPYYVLGFHADEGADAVHDHFVTWSNKKSDRETLIAMDADGNNFDGYSIRYAGELLKRRGEDNKILFVISDGQPACHKYSGSDGIKDTIDAIKDVRKSATVFGIAVGRSCGPQLLQTMYGRDFIFVEDEKLLTNMLCKKLTKVLSKKN